MQTFTSTVDCLYLIENKTNVKIIKEGETAEAQHYLFNTFFTKLVASVYKQHENYKLRMS